VAPHPAFPLAGRVILDCSALLPGPLVGKLLASRGARVIKIESPKRPDPARDMPSYFADLNECKEHAAFDLLDAGDRTRFEALVKSADGLIEGFRPAAKLKLGLDAQSLHAVNPKLCIASLVGYDENGPARDRAGHDLNFSAVTGAVSMFREMPALPLADLFSAYSLALAMAAMLDASARGQTHQRTVVAMDAAVKEMLGMWIRKFQDQGDEPEPGKTLMSGEHPCYRLYVARDGRRIAVGALERKFWEKVCAILGLPELTDQGLATGRTAEETIARVQAAFGSRPWKEWKPLFEGANCCVEPVLDFSEVYGRDV